VPFEEYEKDPSIWFLDHNFLEGMWAMFRKVNAKEKVIGWYHSGPKLRQSDLAINEVIKRFTPHPVLVIVDVEPKELGLPTEAYYAIDEIHDDGTQTTKTFNHAPTSIAAEEAEEIGVEHLLRDIKDNAVSTLSTQVTEQLNSLKSLHIHINDMIQYLEKVIDGQLPVNHQIIYNLQDIFNLLPNLNIEELVRGFSIKTNDQLLTVYLSSLIRSVIALHNLINNKLSNREAELQSEKDEKDKDGKDKDGKEKDKDGKEKDKDGKDAADKDKDGKEKDSKDKGKK